MLDMIWWVNFEGEIFVDSIIETFCGYNFEVDRSVESQDLKISSYHAYPFVCLFSFIKRHVNG